MRYSYFIPFNNLIRSPPKPKVGCTQHGVDALHSKKSNHFILLHLKCHKKFTHLSNGADFYPPKSYQLPHQTCI